MERAINHEKKIPNKLNLTDITSILKKDDSTLEKKIIGQLVLPWRFKDF